MVSFTLDQIFIVTGASSGIGAGVALWLNELGAMVIGIGRNRERLEGMKAQAKHPENVFCEEKDLVSDIPGLPAYVRTLREKYGKFHGMAYCAGIMPAIPLRMAEADAVRMVFDINFFAAVQILRAVADRRNNVGTGTACVFVSSASALLSDRGHGVYAASKAALNAAVRAFAKELAPSGIRLNCVLPTNIRTEKTSQEYLEAQLPQYPLGFGLPLDVAHLVVLLLSSECKWITAQNYVLDCASF